MSPSFRLGASIFTAAMLAAATFALPALAAVTVNETQSLDNVIVTNPVTGEDILLSGSIHLLLKQTSNNNGSHLSVSSNFQNVTGVGLTTGTQYTLHSNDKEKANVADDIFPGVFSFVRGARFISQGGEQNIMLRETFRAVFNNNGTQTVEITRSEVVVVGDGENDNN